MSRSLRLRALSHVELPYLARLFSRLRPVSNVRTIRVISQSHDYLFDGASRPQNRQSTASFPKSRRQQQQQQQQHHYRCHYRQQPQEKIQQQQKQQKRCLSAFHTTVAMNGASPSSSRTKRKAPSSADERPLKQFRHGLNGKASPGENTPDVEATGYISKGDHEDDEVPVFYQSQQADTAEWQATIEKVVRCVVSIRFCQTCSFDTDAACASEATGFVVDAERG
jgi:hypothetical protein